MFVKVIITGATGFIGSCLCSCFQNAGHEVVPLARSLPKPELIKKEIKEWMECDVQSDSLPGAKLSADMIIHLASANEVVSRDVKAGVNISVMGTKNVLDFAVNNRIGKFIFFSTLQVYGTEAQGTISEDTPPTPYNDYGLNHLFAEQYVQMYARKGLVRAGIVRPANVYGPFTSHTVDRWTPVPACFCREAYLDKTITIMSSGKQLRNFVSLDYVSRTIEVIAHRFPDSCDIINIGSSQTYSIMEVAHKVRKAYYELFRKRVRIRVLGQEPVKPNLFEVSLDKLIDYGFQPKEYYSLDGEIRKMLQYLDDIHTNRISGGS
jgi:nucleoside-diphosphate-sugar epimerase